MADVDLTVAVTSSGIATAINELETLQETGGNTAGALRNLEQASRDLGVAMRDGLGAISAKGVLAGAPEAINLTTAALRDQEAEYTRLAKLQVGVSARERLTTFGGGSFNKGMATAAQMEARAEAESASAIRDKMTVEREDMQLQQARTAAMNAQKQVAVARWERELAAMTPVEAASARLTRATQELATATAMMNVADDRLATNKTTANYDYQTQAAIRQAAAIRGLTTAQREFTVAQEQSAAVERNAGTNRANTSNAFQSSYSYFIIAGFAQQAAQAIRDMGAASIGASAQLDRSFADVDRTFDGTDQQLSALRSKLMELSTTTPISFVDLAQIAAMGNQLGIAAGDIQSFTTTISQYSAISGQSAQDSADAFGKISNLTGLAASQYSNLASSIEYTARTSVSTEATITQTAQEITALASGAGFSAQAIVGLSGALSSLSIPPERARGALSLYFGALDKAVAEGGPKLKAFATLANMSQDSITKLVSENKGQQVFTAFISGLSQLNTVAKTSALDELGLSTIRVDQTMRALSQNVPLLTSAFSGADTAFKSDTELARQYGKIQDQLASKFVEFQNQVQDAAAALGGDLGGAVLVIITAVSTLVQGFTQFANTPFGHVVLAIAGAVGALAFAIATVVGALALARASIVVTKFALEGMGEGLTSNSGALIRFVAGMLRLNVASAETTVSTGAAAGATKALSASVREGSAAAGTGAVANGALAVSEEAVNAGGRAAAVGLTVMKVALWSTGIGLAVTLIGSLVGALANAGDQSKITTGDVTGLDDAIKADTATYDKTGRAIMTYAAKLPPATAKEKEAAREGKNLAQVLGTDVSSGAEKAAKSIQKIAAGDKVVEAFRKTLGEKAKDIISDTNFANAWTGLGLNIDTAIASGLKSGGNASKVRQALLDQIGGVKEDLFFMPDSGTPVSTFTKNGKDITKQVDQILKLVPTLASVSDSMQGATNKSTVLGSGVKKTADAAEAANKAFRGATSSIKDYQDSVQKGLGKFVDFKDILKGVQGAQDDANKRKGPDATSTSLINATNFSRDLATANDQAVTFFNGLQTLAANGRSSFATQLAELGPDASLILSDALKLDPGAQQKLEANARFAAFLGSDAFKTTLSAQMQNSNDAYAKIFDVTHSLDAVKSFIAAQVSGAGEEAERQWDIDHPNFPLNITPSLTNPDKTQLDAFSKLISKEIEVSPSFSPSPDPMAPLVKTYRDQLTNASIDLPATLDGGALTASLGYWLGHENQTPEQIAAALNTAGLSSALTDWRNKNGTVSVTVRAHWSIAPLSSSFWVDPRQQKAKGGEIMPHFASGGGWGEFAGPGTGTSDSMLSWVSNGEYINTADATRFWGPDFFDSLNRKMLPTSFLNMLGAAAVSGNQGPTHVAHVQVVQQNPLTRDPLKQLRQDSEMVANGIWGAGT